MLVSSIGFLAPEPPWTASIAGAGGKAVILTHADGAAIAVVSRREDMDARAFCLAEDFAAFSGAAARAARVAYDGRALRLEGGEPATASVLGAEAWDPREVLDAAARDAAGRPAAPGAAAAIIEGALRAERDAGRAREGIHGDGPFGGAFAALKAAPGFPAALVGFGPGSTPAGDDWLAGYLAAADLFGGGPGRAEPRLRAAVEAALGRTTAPGRALLAGALAGAPTAYLVELALAAAEAASRAGSAPAAEARLRAAAGAALARGATSGEDALAGFLEGLKVADGATIQYAMHERVR